MRSGGGVDSGWLWNLKVAAAMAGDGWDGGWGSGQMVSGPVSCMLWFGRTQVMSSMSSHPNLCNKRNSRVLNSPERKKQRDSILIITLRQNWFGC